MMVAAVRNDQSLGEGLVERAQRASILRLTLDIAGGLIAFGVLVAFRPQRWGIPASAALCLAMYGVWGASDRLLKSAHLKNNAIAALLLVIRTIAIAAGVAAALLVLFGTLEITMGVWTH